MTLQPRNKLTSADGRSPARSPAGAAGAAEGRLPVPSVSQRSPVPRLHSAGEQGKSSPGREENRVSFLALGHSFESPRQGFADLNLHFACFSEGLLHSDICGSLTFRVSAAGLWRQEGPPGGMGSWGGSCGTPALLQGSSPRPSAASRIMGTFFHLRQPDNGDVAPSLCPLDLVKRVARARG